MDKLTFISQWFLDNGVPVRAMEYIIAVCILATIVSIARYVLGSKSYGIYAPILLAISYSYTGLRYGLLITGLVILTTLLSYKILSRIRMHYITRIAINYCIISIVMLLMFVLIDKYGLTFENMSNISPLAFISIVALSDFFIKQYVKKSLFSALSVSAGTIIVASIGWLVISRDIISNYLLYNIWILPLLILINILLGRFSGLRIKEYFRFKNISKQDNTDDKEKN